MKLGLHHFNSPISTMVVRVGGMGINYGVLILVARWSGQGGLGIVIALNSAAFLGGMICSLGLPGLLLKTLTGFLLHGETAEAVRYYTRCVRYCSLAALAACILLSIGAVGQKIGVLPEAIGSLGAVELLGLGLSTFGMAVQFLGIGAIRALKQPTLSGVFQFCSQPLLLVILVGALRVLHIETTHSLVAGCVTGSVILNALLIHGFSKKLLGEHPDAKLSPLSPMPWKEARSFWMLGVLSSALSNIPLLLGTVLLAPASVAVLGVPFRICNLPMTIVGAMGAYYAPLIREAHLKNDLAQQKKHLVESQWIGGLLVIPVLGLAVGFPEWLLGLFQIHDVVATKLLLLFAVAQLVIAGCGVSEQYLAMLGESSVAARYTLICFLAVLVSGAVLTPLYGTLGCGLAWAIFAVARQVALRQACNSAPNLAAKNSK